MTETYWTGFTELLRDKHGARVTICVCVTDDATPDVLVLHGDGGEFIDMEIDTDLPNEDDPS